MHAVIFDDIANVMIGDVLGLEIIEPLTGQVEPAKYDIEFTQGTTYSQVFEINPEVIDLSGCTVRSQVRDLTYTTVLATFTVTVDALLGKITIALTDTQTSAIPAGTFVWDLEVVKVDLTVINLIGGECIVNPEVTKPTSP